MSGTAASGSGVGSTVGGGAGQALALGGLGGSLEDKDCDLLCPVCFELIEEAYVTRCGHSFCYACIAKSVELHRRCPKCGAALASRDHIFPNFLLNELVAKRRLRQSCTSPPGAAPAEGARLRQLLAAESRHLAMPDVDSMLDVLTRRKRLLEAESAAAHHRLVYEFLAQLLRNRQQQLEQLTREAALVRADMEHVAGVLRDLRAGAAGLAQLHARGEAGEAGEAGPAGEAVRALRQELAALSHAVSQSAHHDADDGLPLHSVSSVEEEESFAGAGGGAGDALAARWRRLAQHFDDFVQCYFAHRADELYFPGSSGASAAPTPAPVTSATPAPSAPATHAGGAPGASEDHVPQGPPDCRAQSAAGMRRPAAAGGLRRGGGAAGGVGRVARAGGVPRGPGGLHAVPRAAAARHAVLLQRRHQLLHHRVHHRVRQGRRVLRHRRRHQADQGVRVQGGGGRRGGRALPVRGDGVLAQDIVRVLERVPQARARLLRLRGHRVGVGRAHGHPHARPPGARQALLVGALQPLRRAAAGVGLRRRARQAVGAQRGALRRHARGQVQRLLRKVQPQVVVPPGVRVGGPLRALLRPARAAGPAGGVPRPSEGCLLRAVPGRAVAGFRLHGLAPQAVAGGLLQVPQVVHRSREREELRGPGDGRQVHRVRLGEQRALRVLQRAVAAAARVPLRRRQGVPGARAPRRRAVGLRVGRVLAPRARPAGAAGRQQPGDHQGAGAGVSRGTHTRGLMK